MEANTHDAAIVAPWLRGLFPEDAPDRWRPPERVQQCLQGLKDGLRLVNELSNRIGVAHNTAQMIVTECVELGYATRLARREGRHYVYEITNKGLGVL